MRAIALLLLALLSPLCAADGRDLATLNGPTTVELTMANGDTKTGLYTPATGELTQRFGSITMRIAIDPATVTAWKVVEDKQTAAGTTTDADDPLAETGTAVNPWRRVRLLVLPLSQEQMLTWALPRDGAAEERKQWEQRLVGRLRRPNQASTRIVVGTITAEGIHIAGGTVALPLSGLSAKSTRDTLLKNQPTIEVPYWVIRRLPRGGTTAAAWGITPALMQWRQELATLTQAWDTAVTAMRVTAKPLATTEVKYMLALDAVDALLRKQGWADDGVQGGRRVGGFLTTGSELSDKEEIDDDLRRRRLHMAEAQTKYQQLISTPGRTEEAKQVLLSVDPITAHLMKLDALLRAEAQQIPEDWRSGTEIDLVVPEVASTARFLDVPGGHIRTGDLVGTWGLSLPLVPLLTITPEGTATHGDLTGVVVLTAIDVRILWHDGSKTVMRLFAGNRAEGRHLGDPCTFTKR